MNPRQIKLVQDSFAKVASISDQAAVMFYDRLFQVAPAVKVMFPADLTEQRKKLMTMLAVVVNGLSNLESILPAARTLTKRHVNYGAKPEHYPVVGSAVLHAGGRPRLGLDARSRLRSDGCVWHAVRLDDGRNLEHEFATAAPQKKRIRLRDLKVLHGNSLLV